MSKTTLNYKCIPAAANGLTLATTGSAWTSSGWTEIIAANSITTDFYICGITWCWWTPLAAADTTYQIELGIGIGASGSEVEIITIPASVRADTLAGHVPTNVVLLPEPRTVTANTRVAVRIRYGTAAIVSVTGVKILYQN